jgi:hypothetical protein
LKLKLNERNENQMFDDSQEFEEVLIKFEEKRRQDLILKRK